MKFILLKFYDHEEGERKLIDAYVIQTEDGYSFPIRVGDKEIEVYAEPFE